MKRLLGSYKKLIFLAVLLAIIPNALVAQDAAQDPSESAAEETTQEQGSSEDTENQETDEEPSRFIPTEQVSQDLGVSFPADI